MGLWRLVRIGLTAPLDLICALAGSEVEDVRALIDRSAETGADQTWAISLRFAGGVLAQATMTRRSFWPLPSVQVWGTEGTAAGIGTLGMAPSGRLLRTRGSEIHETELAVPNLYAEQFIAFAGAIARGAPIEASGEDGLRSVLLCERLLDDGARSPITHSTHGGMP